MITLTLDKLTPIKAGFSVKDPVYQGPEQSTPRQIVCPRGFTPLKKAVQGRAGLYSVTGQRRDLSGCPIPSPVSFSS
jgi:hypothetical protein